MKPLIGITTQQDPNKHPWAAPMVAQNRQYPDAILAAGGLPVLLPFTGDIRQLRDLYERLDGIVFAGGGDINPAEYGEVAHPLTKEVCLERDRIELQLIKWSIADNKPILAICRGLQLLNVALGGSLIQDIPSAMPAMSNHNVSSDKQERHHLAHTLRIEPGSRTADIIGTTTIATNTHHHQGIKKPAPGLTVTGWAEDGIIECVELASSHFAIGVQSHPESLTTLGLGWQKLFGAFVQAAYSPEISRNSSSTELAPEVLEAL